MPSFTVSIGSNSATSTYTETLTVSGPYNNNYSVYHAFSTPSIGYGATKTFSVPSNLDLTQITVTNVTLNAPSSGGGGTYSITPSVGDIKTRINNGNRSTSLTFAFRANQPSNYTETVQGIVPSGGSYTRSSTRTWSSVVYTVTYTENGGGGDEPEPEPMPETDFKGRITMQDYRRILMEFTQAYHNPATPFNLYNGKYQNGYWNVSNAQYVEDSTWSCCQNPIGCSPQTSYYFKFNPDLAVSTGNVIFLNDSGQVLSYQSTPKNSTLTTPANCRSMLFYSKPAYFESTIGVYKNYTPS